MTLSDSKSFACSDELISSFDGPCCQNYPTVSEVFSRIWNYTQVLPKKSSLSHFLPNKGPSSKSPGFQKAHCTSCASGTCWKCCRREGGGGTAKSRANSVVPHDCLPLNPTHTSCTCYKDYKVRDAFWITYGTLLWISRRKCGSWSPYTFTSHDFYDLPSHLKTCFAGCRCHQTCTDFGCKEHLARYHFLRPQKRAGGIGDIHNPHIHKQALVLHNPHLRKCVFRVFFSPELSLDGGFKHFLIFTSTGKIPILTNIFANGLVQPPTRSWFSDKSQQCPIDRRQQWRWFSKLNGAEFYHCPTLYFQDYSFSLEVQPPFFVVFELSGFAGWSSPCR